MPGQFGNRGGGRKSAYEEWASAARLHEMFFGKQNQQDIEKDINKGEFSLEQRMKLNGMEGSSKELIAIFNKIYPDRSLLDARVEEVEYDL